MDTLTANTQRSISTSRIHLLAKSAGVVFVVAGVGKLLLPWIIPVIRPGSPTFADVLAAIGVPFPLVASIAVCGLEIVGGIRIFAMKELRLWSTLLILNLLGALATLSIPSTFIAPIVVKGLALGNELWRIPVEVGLISALLVCIRANKHSFPNNSGSH